MVYIFVSVLIACFTVFLTWWLGERRSDRVIREGRKDSHQLMTRMERGFLRHYTALFYAVDKASKEQRTITPDDYQAGLKFASEIEGIDLKES